MIFLDGSNVTIKEAEDGSGRVVWEWSDNKRPFSCRPKNGPIKVKISEDLGSDYLEILVSGTAETVLLVSKEEMNLCEEMFEKNASHDGEASSLDFCWWVWTWQIYHW